MLQEDYQKKGLTPLLTIKCTLCNFCTDSYSSRSYDNTFDINIRAAYSMRAIGKGYSELETFTSLMNLPKQSQQIIMIKFLTNELRLPKQ